MKIYIIRHGETDWNVTRKLQGATDIPLNQKGILLAEVTAKAISDIPFDVIFTSPLSRAKKTAEIIRGNRPIPIVEEPRLKEISFGIYEGLSCSKEHYEIPDPEFMSFFLHPESYIPPENAESIEALCERTTDFLMELAGKAEYRDKTILLSTHGAATKGLLSSLTIDNIRDFWNGGVHKNCGISLLEEQDGKLSLVWENKIFYKETDTRGYLQ